MKKILTFLFGCSFLISCSGEQKNKDKVDVVMKAQKGELVVTKKWQGIFRSKDRLEVRAEREMILKKIAVSDFTQIKKGDLLGQLDTRESEEKLKQAQKDTHLAKLNFDSLMLKFRQSEKNIGVQEKLLEKGIIAQKKFDEMKQEFMVMANQIEAEKIKMQDILNAQKEAEKKTDGNLLAPRAGMVSAVINMDNASSNGLYVEKGQRIAIISDPSKLAFWMQVEEEFISKIKNDMTVSLQAAGFEDKKIEGKIFSIPLSGTQDQSTGLMLFEVGVYFEAAGVELREGNSGSAEIIFDKKDDALSVPIKAVYMVGEEEFVRVVQGASHTVRKIKTGLKTDLVVQVTEGLNLEEEIVVEGEENGK